MTIEVAGLWEFGWSVPLTESDHWEMLLREFGVRRLNVTPVSGIEKRWIHEYPTMAHLLDDRAHLTPVFVDERGAEELSTFIHPDNVLYVFGKVGFAPFDSLAKESGSVRIDTPHPGMLWAHQAAAIVLHDRHKK